MKVPSSPTPPLPKLQVDAAASERVRVLDRLQRLRTIVPVFAQELASAKRQVAQLRRENHRLVEEVARLQRHRRAATRGSRREEGQQGSAAAAKR